MKRKVINIDETLCNGCGMCIEGCHEGALQLIDGKARVISDLYCDGLGACIGECPVGAIILEEKETEPYNEIFVMEKLLSKGDKTVIAHLLHLKEHEQTDFFQQGVAFLREKKPDFDFSQLHKSATKATSSCPGTQMINFTPKEQKTSESFFNIPSCLSQWPIQLHLVNPEAPYFKNADIIFAADCVAYSYGNFHNRFMKNNAITIACPKLDSSKEEYIDKLVMMINNSMIRSLNVVIMEVPCCSGLLQIALTALNKTNRNIPIRKTVISIKGEIIEDKFL